MWVALPKLDTFDGKRQSRTFQLSGLATAVEVLAMAAVVKPLNSQSRTVTLYTPPESSMPYFPSTNRQPMKLAWLASYSDTSDSAFRLSRTQAASDGPSNATLTNFHPRPRTSRRGVAAVGEAGARH